MYQGALIAGGGFTEADGGPAQHIARWDGEAWWELGGGIDGNVNGLAPYGDDLVAVGVFSAAGGLSASNVTRWNGATWAPLGAGAGGIGSGLDVVTEFGGDLVVGGSAGPVQWRSGQWEPVGGPTRALYS